jgi:hypothetical protein
MIGGEIRSFCAVLKTLGEMMEYLKTSPHYAHCSEMNKHMTAVSMQMFTEILDVVNGLKKLTKERDSKDGSFGFVE